MTLCVGFTDSKAVYLTADSAVTGPSRPASTEFSTFGEKQPQTPAFTVEESALKILKHGDTAAAFAGDASPIDDLFSNYINGSHVWSPRQAFDNAWASSQDGRDLHALLAYYDERGPHLVRYDSANTAGIEVTSASIGNIGEDDKEYLRYALQTMPLNSDVTDRLACTVCISQRVSILLNIMETHKIGGAIAGCSVSKKGLRWAPDTMHVILRGGMADQLSNDVLTSIVTCTRLDTLFVRNNFGPQYSGFTTSFGVNTGRDRREVIDNIRSNMSLLPPVDIDLKVEYVVFHDVLTHLSTIFDVRAGEHPNLKYWLTRAPSGQLNIHFTASGNGLGALKRTSGDIAFVPLKYS
ncbi:hypothetical protein [Bradyrhizobium elkanii]|uniref:hypothetical protein n=1 Tax=Bradyrhizobium elkanii TaxID=29448 RepID=UPI000841B1C3|nr:hypothetical protein [Bradyrhizobium elkanii]ODM76726.1 hypothetical protein A6X20_29170 [Bradyrhizobium elkanii]ODM80805.1 hypothetical protein A6452_23715 [Bradyrhizobium elkanii]